MALITCPECKKEISDKADKCINCGYPLSSQAINEVELPHKVEITKEEDKKTLECPVEITGKEKLGDEYIGPMGNWILAIWFLIFMIISIGSVIQGGEIGGALFIFFIMGAAGMWLVQFIYIFTPGYYRHKKRLKKIEEYFNERFDVLKEFDHNKHKKLKTSTVYSKKGYNHALFDLFMEAWKLNADAIVVNNNEKHVSVSSDKLRGVTSKSSNQLNGTIIKYI